MPLEVQNKIMDLSDACEVYPDPELDNLQIVIIAVAKREGGVARYQKTRGMWGELVPGELLPNFKKERKEEREEQRRLAEEIIETGEPPAEEIIETGEPPSKRPRVGSP